MVCDNEDDGEGGGRGGWEGGESLCQWWLPLLGLNSSFLKKNIYSFGCAGFLAAACGI